MNEQNSGDQGGHAQENAAPPTPWRTQNIEKPEYESGSSKAEKHSRSDQAAEFVKSAGKTADAVRLAAAASILSAIGSIGAVITGAAQCSFNKAQVEEMRKAASQTERVIENTLSGARLDQRAWIGVRSITLKSFTVGAPIEANVTVYNSGRSFAIAVNTLYHIAVVSGPVTSGEHLLSLIEKNRSMKTVGGGAIAPDAELSVVNYTSENLDKVAFDDIKEGRQTIYVIGEIKYEDIFKERHYTRFFGAYSPRQNAFQPQNTHNEAN